MSKIIFISHLLSLMFLNLGNCNAQYSIDKYDLNHPDEIIELPKMVNEISGITYSNGYVFAIDDEHGDLFRIELKTNPKIDKWNFGKDKDYEDVALFKEKFFVLNSNGHVVEFSNKFPINKINKIDPPIKGGNEFESLYYNPQKDKIVILCKECKADDKDENSAWSFDVEANHFDKKKMFVIKRKEIETVLDKRIDRFKPSAATVNPSTNETYVISSVNKLLVVLKDQKVVKAQELNAKLFNQPEGITFSPDGTLLISNEAGSSGKATILSFRPIAN